MNRTRGRDATPPSFRPLARPSFTPFDAGGRSGAPVAKKKPSPKSLEERGAEIEARGVDIEARVAAAIAAGEETLAVEILAEADAHIAELKAHLKKREAQARRQAAKAKREEDDRVRVIAELDEEIARQNAEIERLNVEQARLDAKRARIDAESPGQYRRNVVKGGLGQLRDDHDLADRGTGKTASTKRKKIAEGVERASAAIEDYLMAAEDHLEKMSDELDKFESRYSVEVGDRASGTFFKYSAVVSDHCKHIKVQLLPAIRARISMFRVVKDVGCTNATRTLGLTSSIAQDAGLVWKTQQPEHQGLVLLAQFLSREGLKEAEAWSLVVDEDSSFDPPRPLECLGDGEEQRGTWRTYWKRYQWKPAEASE